MKRLLALMALASAFQAAALCAEDEELIIAPRISPDSQDLSASHKKLFSPDFAQAEAAAQELVNNRDAKAVGLIWALYNGGDAARRLLAVRSIGRLGQAEQADNLRRVAIGDLYLAIRLTAAEELARLETPDKAAARLAKTADDRSLRVVCRWRAVQAVAQVKGRVATECLRRWLKGPERNLTEAAAEGLGRMGDLSQADSLIIALETPDAELKPAIAEALEEMTGQKLRYDLVKWSAWLKEWRARPAQAVLEASSPGSAPDQNPPLPRTATEEWWDMVIVFDTTGSMAHVWPFLEPALDAVTQEAVKQAPGSRLGSVRYRAAVPELSLLYTVKADPLSRDLARVRQNMKDALFGGDSGGLHLGLDAAVRTMLWRVAAWRYDSILVNVVYVRSAHGKEHAQTYRALALSGPGHYFEYDKAERRLVDRAENEKADARLADSPAQLAAKWLTPRK